MRQATTVLPSFFGSATQSFRLGGIVIYIGQRLCFAHDENLAEPASGCTYLA